MNSTHSRQIKLIQILLSAAIVFVLILVREAKAGDGHEPLVTDWSHRHLVFSEPNSLMKRFELSSNPRYVQQLRRRNAERLHGRDEWRWHHASENPNRIQGDWSMDMGAGATVGAGNYPAKYSFDATTAHCATDFVVYNTSVAGNGSPGSQATIVAFNNIYVGTCGGGPTTYWAYNTGTAGAVMTSPVLSYDGTQVAFVQNTSTGANLVILRWKADGSTLTSPTVPSSGPCSAATAPCMVTIPFSTANSDTSTIDNHSSPFYDYSHDIIYVGDDTGFLHKFTGIFFGAPTEIVSTGPNPIWPAATTTIGGGHGYLNGPVLVDTLNEVLVTGSDGVLYAMDATAGGVYPTDENFTPKLASFGFDDGPLVDLTSGLIYVFARADNASNVASVIQFTIPTTSTYVAFHTNTGNEKIVSNSATTLAAFYDGTFDDTYYSSADGTGNLYACSTSGTVNAIWRIPIISGTMQTPILGPTLTSSLAGCSPITEFKNTSTSNDRIFLSVTGSAITGDSQIKCPASSGCVMSFDVGTPLTGGSGTSATASEAGGTSAIIIDNSDATATGADQVYFTPLADQLCQTSGGTGGCAIQASQSGLN
jgi:hypothetical protein